MRRTGELEKVGAGEEEDDEEEDNVKTYLQ